MLCGHRCQLSTAWLSAGQRGATVGRGRAQRAGRNTWNTSLHKTWPGNARKCQEMRYKWDEKSRYPESRYHLERHPWVLVSWGINNKRLGKDQSTLCSMYPLHFATSIASLHSWAACGTSHILHYFEFANEKNSSLKHFETTCLDFLGLDTILVFNISLRQICASALTLWRHGASGVLQWLLQLRPRHTTVALCRKPHLRVLRKRGVRGRLYTSRAHGRQHIVLSPGMPHWCLGLSRYV